MRIKEKKIAKEKNPTGFGERLKTLRMSKGLTANQLGDAVGLSYVTILKYEKESMRPTWETMDSLAEKLGTTSDYLVKGKIIEVKNTDTLEVAYQWCNKFLDDNKDRNDLSSVMMEFVTSRIKSKMK